MLANCSMDFGQQHMLDCASIIGSIPLGCFLRCSLRCAFGAPAVPFGASSVCHSVRAAWPFGAMGLAFGASHGANLLVSVCHSRGVPPVGVARVLRQPMGSGHAACPWKAVDACQQFVCEGVASVFVL